MHKLQVNDESLPTAACCKLHRSARSAHIPSHRRQKLGNRTRANVMLQNCLYWIYEYGQWGNGLTKTPKHLRFLVHIVPQPMQKYDYLVLDDAIPPGAKLSVSLLSALSRQSERKTSADMPPPMIITRRNIKASISAH